MLDIILKKVMKNTFVIQYKIIQHRLISNRDKTVVKITFQYTLLEYCIVQAALGGSTGNLQLVHAFLRVGTYSFRSASFMYNLFAARD